MAYPYQPLADPYQLRRRDSSYAVVGAMQQWLRKRFNANDLLIDADPTVRMPSAYANPYQLRYTIPWNRQRPTLADQSLPSYGSTSHVQFLGSNPTWGSQQQVNRRRFNVADQSDATDPTTLRRVTQQPYQLYDRTYWTRTRPVFIDQSDQLADPTITHPPWQAANPYQLRQTPTWIRTKYPVADQSDQTVAIPDADPNIKQLSQYSNPWQLRRTLPWYRIRPAVVNQATTDDTPGGIHIQLVGITRTYGSQFQVAQWRRNLADQSDQTPIPDADPTAVRILSMYARPYQLYDRTYWTRTKTILVDQSDQTPFTPPPPQVFPASPPGGTSLGRRGPWYPDRTPERVLLEEEEIMVVF